MALPTRTVHQTYTNPATGEPAEGRVVLTPIPEVWTDADGEVIYPGGGTFVLDEDGAWSHALGRTDAPGVEPAVGRFWHYEERLKGGLSARERVFALPEGDGQPISISQLVEADPGATEYTPVVGPTGPAGPAGPPGPAGADGQDGAPGAPGADGQDGAPGAPGAPGADGEQGPQGIQGIQGVPGAAGDTGPAGAAGPQGVPGADGARNRTSEVRINDGAVQDLATAASWTICATSVGTPLQGRIPAEPGDRIRVDLGMLYSGTRFLDLVLLDSGGAIAQYAGSGTGTPLTEGNPEFYPSTSFGKASSSVLFTVSASHLASGQVTVALANRGTGAGRVYAFADYPFRMTLSNLGPAPAPASVSVAQTSTPASGYIKYAPAGVSLSGSDVTGTFSYLGAGGFQIGSGTPDSTYVLPTTRYPNTRGVLSSSQSIYSVEFGTDATAFQLRFNWQTGGSVRISVNGRPMTDLMQSLGGTTLGSTHMLTVTLGAAQPRTVRLDFSVAPFGGIYLPPGATMWKPPAPVGRIMVFGDSIPGGSSMNSGGGAGTWFPRAARALGYADAWNEALGSTGYITAGSTATLGTRAPIDVIPHAPDVLLIWAGYNDSGGSQPAIASAAASLYSAITDSQTGLPDCTVYVLGCWSPTGSPGASLTNTDATLRTAAAAAGLAFISPITGSVYDGTGALVATHGPWITGTGRVGATTGSGNADVYIGTDGVHPTNEGHTYLASRVVAAIQELTA